MQLKSSLQPASGSGGSAFSGGMEHNAIGLKEGPMLSLDGRGIRCCDGVTRRESLKIGGLGAAGLTLPSLLELRAEGYPNASSVPFGRAKRCIILFMSGGPPQMDT